MRALLVIVLVGGCSFIASEKPPAAATACMRSRGPAVLDTVVIATASALFASAEVCNGGGFGGLDGTRDCLSSKVVYGLATIAALPYLFSAVYGYTRDLCPGGLRGRE